MATQTTYYEFNKPSGSDLVNPLTDTNPNWDIADAGLHELDERSIANATETVVLGVHAISRLNTYTKFIKWIATANFTAGDTFTVDGNVVAASTPSGAALETNAYVTGTVVLACLNADDSAMTIFVSGTTVASDSQRLGGELPSYYATASALGSAETDIDNIQALNGNTSIASIGDGTLTGGLHAVNTGLTNINNLLNVPLDTEVEVGKYGSDVLYMKSYKGTGTISNTGLLIDNTISSSNIIPIDIRGTILVGSNYHGVNSSGGSYYLTSCNVESSGIKLYADGGWVGSEYAVTIYYIKRI